MFVVTVHLEVVSDQFDAFIALMQAQADNSMQLEPDCHQFDVCTDALKPGEVYLYELYSSKAAFEHHLASRHFLEFDAAVKPMLISKTVTTWSQHSAGG